jgi:hypothetical protein
MAYPWYTGAAEPPAAVQPAAPDFGENWSDTLRLVAAYGLSRAIDAQYATPYDPAPSERYGVDQYGRAYILGQSASMPSAGQAGAISLSPSLVILAVLGLLFLR